MQENKFYISNLASILKDIQTLNFINEDILVILENTIDELTSLSEHVLETVVEHSIEHANADMIFLQALQQIPISTIEKSKQEIEYMLEDAQSKGHTKLTEALTTLLEDAKKWQSEFRNKRLDFKDTDSELKCLSFMASDLITAGEEKCHPEIVKGYLTQEHIYPISAVC